MRINMLRAFANAFHHNGENQNMRFHQHGADQNYENQSGAMVIKMMRIEMIII